MKKLLKLVGIFCLIICLIGSVVIYGKYVSVNSLMIMNQKIESEKITKDLNNLKIAFISDIHFNHFMNSDRLMNMIEKINANKPDIILLGGDLFDDPSLFNVDDEARKQLIHCLKALHANEGKFAVLGEEDHDENVSSFIEDLLFQADFELLNNEHIQLTKNGDSFINLIGIDSIVKGNPDIEKSFEDVNTKSFTIVLSHAPDIIKDLPKSGIDLVLTGHSHGGQISLPFIGSLTKIKGASTYTKGDYLINQTRIIVSNGLGTTGQDIRIFSDPQCHMIRLTRK